MTPRPDNKLRMLRFPRARGRGKQSHSSGQLYLDFDDQDEQSVLSLIAAPETVESCFRDGCIAEDSGRFEDATRAYQQALELGGPLAAICFNLANSLYALGNANEAADQFRQLVAREPHYCEGWNNLGVVLADLGDASGAEAAFKMCLELDLSCADAHYNLADLFDQLDKPVDACNHWRAYLQLECDGLWAEHARSRLLAQWFPR